MKQGIHPKYFPDATIVCACGNTWQTGSTTETIHTDVCSKCHPFYTGEQRIVDTEGQVDRFYKKLQARQEYLTEVETREASRTSPELAIKALELGTRAESEISKPWSPMRQAMSSAESSSSDAPLRASTQASPDSAGAAPPTSAAAPSAKIPLETARSLFQPYW